MAKNLGTVTVDLDLSPSADRLRRAADILDPPEDGQDDALPRLGFATTRELIDELRARADVDATIGDMALREHEHVTKALDVLSHAMRLDYRTVDS